MGLFLGLVLLAGSHISTAMVIGAILKVLTGCLTTDAAYQSVDWRTVFLVAGMLPLGTAMEWTGAARFPRRQVTLRASRPLIVVISSP
jgi:di/tricarboxylate transporter